LRKGAPDPEVELHPDCAAARDISAGSWVTVETQAGAMRARARLNDKLDPRVIVGEHGWWQACKELDAPGYDPFSAAGSNINLTVDATVRDPISGTPEHHATLCEVRPAEMGSVNKEGSSQISPATVC
jgi:anaerobic selenocysteine-containing dehydrogenase